MVQDAYNEAYEAGLTAKATPGRYQLQAGRGIVRDGVHVASITRMPSLSPTEADALAREIVDALNRVADFEMIARRAGFFVDHDGTDNAPYGWSDGGSRQAFASFDSEEEAWRDCCEKNGLMERK